MCRITRSTCIRRLLWLSVFTALVCLGRVAQAQVPERPSLVIVSAASYEAQAVAPNSIAAIFGNRLSTQTLAAETRLLPLRLGLTTVTVRDARNIEHSAGLFFVSPEQINFLVPPQAASGVATVTVNNGTERITGTVTLAPVAPGLFTANANGRGPALGLLLRVNPNGSQQTEPLAEFNQACRCFVARPVSFGAGAEGQRFLVLFGTGLGNRTDTRNLSVRIGGVPALVNFAGAQGDFPGLDQINLSLASSAIEQLSGGGRIEIVLSAAGFGTSNVIELARAANDFILGVVQITGFEPARVLAGERLTIRGSGFGLGTQPRVGEVIAVRIGNLPAPVLSSNETALTVQVPYGVASDKVSVRVGIRGNVSAAALPVRTSLSGLVEDARRRPLAGVRVTLSGTTLSARTNAEGLFVLPDAPANPNSIVAIDGAELGLTAEFPRVRLSVPVLANRDNFIPHPIILQQATGTPIKVSNPALGAAAEAAVQEPAYALQPGALWPLLAEFDMSQQQQAGSFAFTLPNNALVVPNCDDPALGVTCLRPIEQLTLTQIENSRTPVPLPRGYFSAAIAQISPLNASILLGGKLTLPNLDRWPADQPVKLFHLTQSTLLQLGLSSPAIGGWIEYPGRRCPLGQPCPAARVSRDGQRIETNEGTITATGIYFAALERPTATLTGRLVQTVAGGVVIIGGQPDPQQRPLARALVAARGQVTVTDDNGGFVLRHLPVLGRGDVTAVEFSLIRFDERGNARVERMVRDVTLIPNTLTDLETIEANPVNENRPPLIFAGARFALDEGKTSDYNLLVTDADSGANAAETLRVNLSGPAFATLIARGEGRYTLRLTPGFADAGEHRVTITATDRAGATATQLLVLTVNDINQAPRAVAQNITLDEDTPKPIVLTGIDPDRDALRFTIITQPRNGRLSGTAPDLVYTPNAHFFGADSFTFKVSDGVVESEAATVTIQVNPVNDAPALVVPGEQRVEVGQTLSFTISADDADGNDRVTIAAQNLPTGATLTPVAVTGARAAARFEWAPTTAQTGLFIVSLQATDDGTPALTTTRTVAITVAAAGETAAGVWQATGGPAGGADLSAIFTQDGLVLAGTSRFGIYRSTNNGQAWTRNNDDPTTPNFVLTFAAGSNSLFAASSFGGVYRSDDRGLSWQTVGRGLPVSGLTFVRVPYLLAARGTTVFAVFRDSSLLGSPNIEVYRSTDNGANFVRVEGGLPRTGEVVALVFSERNVFAAFSTGLYRSGDNGSSWQEITPTSTEGLVFVDLLVNGNELFAVTRQGLLRSSDQGATWVRLERAPASISQLALSGANLFAVALNGTQQSVYRSTDNGVTWTRTDTGLPPTGDFVPVSGFRLAANATQLFVNAFGRLYVSANQGERWELAAPLTDLTVRTLATLNAGTNDARLFAGTEIGVSTATAPWRNWQPANNGLPISDPLSGLSMLPLNQLFTLENLLFAQFANGIFRTADNGRSWQPSNSGLPLTGSVLQAVGAHRTALFVSLAEANLLGGSGTNYSVYRSLDRGATWQEAKQGLPNTSVLCFAATGIEADVILAGTLGAGVYLSADNGTTWRALNQGLPPNSTVFALVSLPGGSRLIAATQGGLFVFNSANQSWARGETGFPAGTTTGALHVAGGYVFAVTATGLAACPAGGILLPDQDGRLRCFGTLTPGPRPRGLAAATSPEQLAASFGTLLGEVYVSTDQGTTWAAVGNGLPRGVTITVGSSGRTVFAGTAGGGVFVRQF